MKKLSFVIILFILHYHVFSQIKSNLDIFGEYSLVVNVDDTTIDLYAKTKNWIIETYINPERVIVADEENQLLKISGLHEESNFTPAYYYTLTFEFKPARYRLTFRINRLYTTGQFATEWTYDTYFNKNTGEVRKMNEQKVERVLATVDRLLNNHYRFLHSEAVTSDDDW